MNRRLFVRRLAMAIVAPVAGLVAAKQLTPEPDYTMTLGAIDGSNLPKRLVFTELEDSSSWEQRLRSGRIADVPGFHWLDGSARVNSDLVDYYQKYGSGEYQSLYTRDLRFLRGKQWTAAEVAARGPVASDRETGISMRFIKQFDIEVDHKPARMDWEYDSVSNNIVQTRVVGPDKDGVIHPNCQPGERLVVSGGKAHIFPALGRSSASNGVLMTPGSPPLSKLIEAHIDGVYATEGDLERMNNLIDDWKEQYPPIKKKE